MGIQRSFPRTDPFALFCNYLHLLSRVASKSNRDNRAAGQSDTLPPAGSETGRSPSLSTRPCRLVFSSGTQNTDETPKESQPLSLTVTHTRTERDIGGSQPTSPLSHNVRSCASTTTSSPTSSSIAPFEINFAHGLKSLTNHFKKLSLFRQLGSYEKRLYTRVATSCAPVQPSHRIATHRLNNTLNSNTFPRLERTLPQQEATTALAGHRATEALEPSHIACSQYL